MRYVIFPSFSYPNQKRASLQSFFLEHKIAILTGPTESGLYIIEGEKQDIERVKETIHPFYVMFEDFESSSLH